MSDCEYANELWDVGDILLSTQWKLYVSKSTKSLKYTFSFYYMLTEVLFFGPWGNAQSKEKLWFLTFSYYPD